LKQKQQFTVFIIQTQKVESTTILQVNMKQNILFLKDGNMIMKNLHSTLAEAVYVASSPNAEIAWFAVK